MKGPTVTSKVPVKKISVGILLVNGSSKNVLSWRCGQNDLRLSKCRVLSTRSHEQLDEVHVTFLENCTACLRLKVVDGASQLPTIRDDMKKAKSGHVRRQKGKYSYRVTHNSKLMKILHGSTTNLL